MRREWLEYEHLDREVGVDVVVAHEADHLAPRQFLDLEAHALLHNVLPAAAQVEHSSALTGVGKRLLADGEAVLQDDEDAILSERRLCLGRSAAGRSGERPDDGVGDGGRELAARMCGIGAHRLAAPLHAEAPQLENRYRNMVACSLWGPGPDSRPVRSASGSVGGSVACTSSRVAGGARAESVG